MVSCSLGTDHIGHHSSHPGTGSGCICSVRAHCKAHPQARHSRLCPRCTRMLCLCGWHCSDILHIGSGQSLHTGCPRVAHSWHRHTRTGAQSSVHCSCSVHTGTVPSRCIGALSHWGHGTQIPDPGRTAQPQSTHRADPGGQGHSWRRRGRGGKGGSGRDHPRSVTRKSSQKSETDEGLRGYEYSETPGVEEQRES